jgi:fibronectin-binding autotransporter adhesin
MKKKQLNIKSTLDTKRSNFFLWRSYTSKSTHSFFKINALFFLLFIFSISESVAVTYYSRAGGNWNNNNTWSLSSAGGAVGVGVFPVAGDDVIIEGGFTVNVNVASACANLNVGQTGNGTLAYTAAVQLTISNNLVIGAGGGSGTINGMSAATRILSIGGAVTIGGAATFTKGTGTVILTGTSTLPATVFNDFTNLTIQSGTTTLGSNTTVSATLTVRAGATLNLNTFTLGSPTSIALENGTTASTISGTGLFTLGGDVAVTTPAGTGTGAVISCPVALTNATTRTFTVADASVTAGDLQISGIISTTGALTKAGAGRLTLSGNNTYSGLTTISAGTIKLGATGDATNTPLGTTGAGTSVTAGATLDLNGFTLGTAEALTINGTGIATGGALSNGGGDATYSGVITFNTAASIVGESGRIIITGTPVSAGTAITLGGSAGGSFTTVIAGARTLTKQGSGTWVLSATNTYTGATTVSVGVLRVQNNSSLGSATATSVASGAAIEIDGNGLTIAEPINTLIGSGVSSGGALRNLANNNTWSGAITLGAAGARINSDGGTLTVSGGVTGATQPLTVGGSGNIDFTTAAIGTTSGTLTKDGTGTVTMSFANTYTGATAVNAGTLRAGVITSAFGSGSNVTMADVATAILDLNNFNNTIGSLAGGGSTGGNVTLGSATLTTGNASNTTYAGVISGTGAVTKAGAGTWTVSGSNTYSGLTTINAGTFRLGAAGDATNTPLGTTGAATTVASGAALDLNGFTLGTAEAITISGTGVGANGAITNSSATGATYSGLVALGNAASIIAASGDINISNAGTITGATFGLTVGGASNGTLSSVVGTTSGTLTKSGNGTWTISGDNTFTGATTISAGTLKLGANGGGTNTPLGTTAGSTSVTSGASLDLNGYTLGTAEPLTINGTGIVNGGALTNTGGNASYSGAITLGAATSIITTTSGSMTLSGNMSGNEILTVGGDGIGTYSAVRSGNASATLIKTGTGTWTFSGLNSYAGKTTISAGAISINTIQNVSGGASSLGTPTTAANGTIDMAASTTLTYTGSGHSSNRVINLTGASPTIEANGSGALTLSGGITGNTQPLILSGSGDASQSGVIATTTGTLTKNGAGTWTLSGCNTYTGATIINEGILKSGAGCAAGTYFGNCSPITLPNTAGVTLDVSGSNTAIGSLAGGGSTGGGVVLGTSTLTVGCSTSNTTYDGIISGTGAITKVGTGTWTVGGSNTYTGATNINAGIIQLGSSGDATNTPLGTIAAATTVASGAALDLNGFTLGTSEAIRISGTGVGANGAITNSSATGAGYSGLITLGAAASIIAVGGDINLSNTGTISGATFGLTVGGAYNGTLASVVGTTTGTFTKSGNGTWTVSGNNTFSGATTISAGTLKLGASGDATNTPLGTVAGGITVSNGASLDLNGFTLGTSEALSISGTGVSSGGALSNNGTVDATYSGIITFAAAGTSIVGDGANINITATPVSSANGIILGGASGGNFTTVIAGARTLTKQGSGTWKLSNANTYTGATTISEGILELGAASAIRTSGGGGVVLGGGTLSTGSGAGFSDGTTVTPIAVGLTLNDNSEIVLGTGSHTLAFAASNAIPWTSGALLFINGWQGSWNGTAGTAGRIFVGAAATGLTVGQLAQVLFYDGDDYFSSTILASGEVVPLASLASTPSPGGVAISLVGWFKANSSGNDATTWNNSANAFDATGTGTPTYNTSGADLINFNESYSFTNGRYFTLSASIDVGGNAKGYTMFGTAKLKGTDNQRVFGNSTSNGLFGYYTNMENALFMTGVPSFLTVGANGVVTNTNDVITHTHTRSSAEAVTLRRNGIQTCTNSTSDDVVWRMNLNGYSNGAEPSDCIIPEFISYNRLLNATEIQQVESYLAIKYGWTLDQTTPKNYINSDETVIWNATSNSTYNKNITGIARDDISELNQKVSSSTHNTSDIITIALDNNFTSPNAHASRTTTFSADKSALIWGHNNGPTEFGGTYINTTLTSAFKRYWKAQTTNFTNTVYVQFVDGDIANSTQYQLIGKTSESGSWSVLATATSESAGNTIKFGSVVFTGTTIFTISDPLPIEINESAAYEVTGIYTFTVPACVTSIDVECWGAGGGGGGNSTAANGAAGGGGGAYSKRTISVTAGATYTLVVGASGAGGADVGSGTGGTGGDSYFTTSVGAVLVLAKGGSGGTFSGTGGIGGAGGAASLGTGTIRYSGGTGSTGNGAGNSVGGGGGSAAGYSYNGNNGKATNGDGAWSMGTPGGAARTGGARGGAGGYYSTCNPVNEGPAEDGYSGGGGGGGGAENTGLSSAKGGAGGVGKIVITTTRVASYATQGTNVNAWIAPVGITKALISVWGAGGGGGGNNTATAGGGGGGGGAFSRSVVSVIPGNTYSLTVGAGGIAGTDINDATGDGGAGGDSWFTNGASTLALAKGGSGGARRSSTQAGGAGGPASSGIGDFKYSGGNGGNGNSTDWGFAGGGGASAGYYANGGNGGNATGGGACANVWGDGGVAPEGGTDGPAGKSHFNKSVDGDGHGAGGGGAGEESTTEPLSGYGGVGGDGLVIVDWNPILTIGTNSVVALSDIKSNTTNVEIHGFSLTVDNDNDCGDMIINDLSFRTTGGYLASDITNFKLYYTTAPTFSTTNLLATNATPVIAGAQTPFSFTHTITTSPQYFWIAMDVSATATNRRDIIVSSTIASDISATFNSMEPYVTGSASASGTQTFTGRLNTSETYTNTATWTVPSSVCSIVVDTWGGGGGGSGMAAGADGGAGGGGGAFSRRSLTVVPGQTYSIVVGSGGSGGASTGSATGGTGGDTYFVNSSGTVIVLAKGGSGGVFSTSGGTGGAGGPAASGTGTIRFSGGAGGTGSGDADYAPGGGGGGSGGYSSNGKTGKSYLSVNDYPRATPGAAAVLGGASGGDGGYWNVCTATDGGRNAQVGSVGGGGGGGAGQPTNGNNGYGGAGGVGKLVITYQRAVTFSSTGTNVNTWVPAGGVTSATVSVWGAGGGGGGNNTSDNYAGAGGGGGGFSQSVVSVTPGVTYSLTVGAGGAGGTTAASSSGTAGGASWFTSSTTTLVLARGGSGGAFASAAVSTGGAGGGSATGTGTLRYSGGNGGSSNNTGWGKGGSGGASAGLGGNGGNGSNDATTGCGDGNGLAGGVAPTGGVDGASGVYSTWYSPSRDGEAGGAGGQGGNERITHASGAGGDGGSGKVTIEWDTDLYPIIGDNVQSAKTVCAGETGVVIHSFTLTDYFVCDYVSIVGLGITTTGTYSITDITNFKLYYSTVNNFASATLITTNNNPAAAGTQEFFTPVRQQATETEYYWITMDVEDEANSGTITVTSTTAQLFSSSYTPTGSGSASGQITIQAAITSNTVSSAQFSCTGDIPAALSGTAPSGGSGSFTYLWEESVTSSTAGFGNATGTNNTQNYTPGALTQDTWYRRKVSSSTCDDSYSDAIKVTVLQNTASTYYWKGTTSDNWATASNWCSAVPTTTNNVVIPPATPNSPVIQADGAVCKDITINTNATLTTNTTYSLGVYGNWDNDGTYTPVSGAIHFKGSVDQSIDGSGAQTFSNLTVNNTGTTGNDEITLVQPVTVTNQLTLTDGIIVSNNTEILTLSNTATTATNGGNAGSFVRGPIRWNGLNGAGPFVFPTGKANKWARVALSNVSTPSDFTCQYFNTTFTNVATSALNAVGSNTLVNVSANEYWDVERTVGAGNAAVTLYWENADASGITSCAIDGNLVVAHYRTDNLWYNENVDGTVVTSDVASCVATAAGWVTSDQITSFSPQAFGNINVGVNPLPIELLSFKATFNGKTVDINWGTATEINNDYFTIEYSKDGVNFYTVAVVKSKAINGTSSTTLFYYYNDPNRTPGTYYYRLKQTDFDGKYSYSNISVVVIKPNTDFSFNVSPNPNNGKQMNIIINSKADEKVVVNVYNSIGQFIYTLSVTTYQDGENIFPLNIAGTLSGGLYIFKAIPEHYNITTVNVIVN